MRGQGLCVAGEGGACMGVCMAGETAYTVDDTHPTGMHSCSPINTLVQSKSGYLVLSSRLLFMD